MEICCSCTLATHAEKGTWFFAKVSAKMPTVSFVRHCAFINARPANVMVMVVVVVPLPVGSGSI
jgi:hypothetical protein